MSQGKTRNQICLSNLRLPAEVAEFVSVQNDVAYCTSVQVAEKFGIEHFILRNQIRDLINEKELSCSGKVNNLFLKGISYDCCLSDYLDSRNRTQQAYLLTFEAFLLVSMAAKSDEAREWRRRYIAAFRQVSKLLLDTANEKIRQLTKPQESIWIPVHNEFDNRVYKILVPKDSYSEEQRLVIRKASAAVHAKATLANTRKWEKDYLNSQSALSFMPTINCAVNSDGSFQEIPRITDLKLGRLPKLVAEAFKRVSIQLTAIRKK